MSPRIRLQASLLSSIFYNSAPASRIKFARVSSYFRYTLAETLKTTRTLHLQYFRIKPSEIDEIIKFFPYLTSILLKFKSTTLAGDLLPPGIQPKWLLLNDNIEFFSRLHHVYALTGVPACFWCNDLAHTHFGNFQCELRTLRVTGSNSIPVLLLLFQHKLFPHLTCLEICDKDFNVHGTVELQRALPSSVSLLRLHRNTSFLPTSSRVAVDYGLGLIPNNVDNLRTNDPDSFKFCCSFLARDLQNALCDASVAIMHPPFKSEVRITSCLTTPLMGITDMQVYKRLKHLELVEVKRAALVPTLAAFMYQCNLHSLSLNLSMSKEYARSLASAIPHSVRKLYIMIPHTMSRSVFNELGLRTPQLRYLYVHGSPCFYYKKFADAFTQQWFHVESLYLVNVVFGKNARPVAIHPSIMRLFVISNAVLLSSCKWDSVDSLLRSCPYLLELQIPLETYPNTDLPIYRHVSFVNKHLTGLEFTGTSYSQLDESHAQQLFPYLLYLQQPPVQPDRVRQQRDDMVAFDFATAGILMIALLLL
ncbi:hypothetical protein GEMRC1_005980 [Eukaryota sp. GEM-RC1]